MLITITGVMNDRGAREVENTFTDAALASLRATPLSERPGKASPPIPNPLIPDSGACPLCDTRY